MFIEVDRIARMRRKLTKGVRTVFCKISRGRIGWDIYKATVSFRLHNRELLYLADIEVSERELERFLQDQQIRI